VCKPTNTMPPTMTYQKLTRVSPIKAVGVRSFHHKGEDWHCKVGGFGPGRETQEGEGPCVRHADEVWLVLPMNRFFLKQAMEIDRPHAHTVMSTVFEARTLAASVSTNVVPIPYREEVCDGYDAGRASIAWAGGT
jgi:hypothetical protein